MVESPKVATYDLQPEMNAVGVGDAMVAQIKAGTHPFMVCNFAPPDMVGHTGVMEKAIIAAAATDVEIGKIAEACKVTPLTFTFLSLHPAPCTPHPAPRTPYPSQVAGVGLFITSDHGNCETMLTEDNKPITSHSCTPVPFVGLLPGGAKFAKLEGGVADVAPTLLAFMGLPIPPEMSGKSML
jgi:2,3-bisphosphoglycerate-independent phosphoglycerate mutase|tara:strand:+ start:257 stop:805 length:549 start_codon:yes stop_codon:yes gene_type:complete